MRRRNHLLRMSTMPLPFIVEDVLSSNNQCIERLDSSNLLDGLHILHQALARMKAMVVTSTGDAANFIDLREHRLPALFKMQLRDEPISTPQVFDHRSSITPYTESFVVCSRPLLLYLNDDNDVTVTATTTILPEEPQNDNQASFIQIYHLVCSVLLFNIALILHHYGCSIRNESMRYDSMIRAFKLYALLAELRRSNGTDERTNNIACNQSFSTARVFVVTLALNNMGHISLILYNPTGYSETMLSLEQIVLTRHYEMAMTHIDGTNTTGVILVSINRSDTELWTLYEIRINVMCWKFGIPSYIALAA